MLELRQKYPLAALLKLANLSRSTFYYQLLRLKTEDKHVNLKALIQAVYARHQGRYGYRRVTAAIRQSGQLVNHKLVQRQMGLLGLKSIVRPKRYRSYKGDVGKTAPNHLERNFDADAANQKWVTDVTEFRVGERKLFLSPIMDLYNGEIVSYEIAERPKFALVESMLRKALRKLGKDQTPMLHSDQGWPYRMPDYQAALCDRKVVQSMSRRGNCLDNAAMESFFAVLKTEFFYPNKFTSVDELAKGLRRYIHYYNHDRIKLKLNGLSPVQFRTQRAAT